MLNHLGHNREANVGLDQGKADLAQGLADVFIGDRTLAA